jgi:hypothetical protein
MTPELKKLWVDALRSGNYDQTKQYLKVQDDVDDEEANGFCCLGVLMDIAGTDDEKETHEWEEGFAASMLSHEWCHKHFLRITDRNHLAEMNDDGESFAEIADYIEGESL